MLLDLANFLENSPSLYFIRISMLGVYSYVNDVYKNDFNHLYSDFIGKIALTSVHPDDKEICIEASNNCVNNPTKVIIVDFRKAGIDGKDIYIRWNLFAIKNEADEIIELGFVGFNITDLFEEKNYHKNTLQKLQAALANSDEAFYFLDANMRVLSFNQAAKNATQYLFNKEIYEGYDFKQSLVPRSDVTFITNFKKAMQGEAYSEENEITFPTGHTIWYKMNMQPTYDDHRHIIGVTLTYTNIDRYKKTTIRLKEIAWHQSHKVRKPLSNILGLVNILKEIQLQEKDQEVLEMLESSAKELDDIIKDIVIKTLI